MSGDVVVDQFDQVRREEPVGFAEVDVDAGKSGFCQPFLLAGVAVLVVPVAGRFVALFFPFATALLVGDIEFGRILVIFEQTVEFERYDAFDQVLLVQPFEFSENRRQGVGDLFFIDFYFLDAVYQIEELFFADLRSGRNHCPFELLADNPFDAPYFPFLLAVYDRDRYTRFPGASGTSAAVGVRFDIVGQSVIDDMRQVVYVEPAGCYVGGD